MSNKINILSFIKQFVVCQPRLGKNLPKAEKLITDTLAKHNFEYKKQVLPAVETANILVGNLVNPKAILLTHFDSIGPGALDNASGVAVSMAVLVNNPGFIRNNLVVFSGCEEKSHEKPIFWGYGYRQFEKKYGPLLQFCKAIYVVDSIGNGKLHFFQGDYYFHQAVPLNNLKAVKHKLFVLTGSVKKLLAIYHTSDDTTEKLSKKYLEASYRKLAEVCR